MTRFKENLIVSILIALAIALPLGIFADLAPLSAQTTQVHNNPDCQFFFSASIAGTTSLPAGNGFDNRQQGCTVWSVSYTNSGFSPVSIILQSQGADMSGFGSGFPVQQTIINGSNPQTNTIGGFLELIGINGFVRVQIAATGTGVVKGAVFGWRIPNAQ